MPFKIKGLIEKKKKSGLQLIISGGGSQISMVPKHEKSNLKKERGHVEKELCFTRDT